MQGSDGIKPVPEGRSWHPEITAFHPGHLKETHKKFECMLWNKNETVAAIKKDGWEIIETDYQTGCRVVIIARKALDEIKDENK